MSVVIDSGSVVEFKKESAPHKKIILTLCASFQLSNTLCLRGGGRLLSSVSLTVTGSNLTVTPVGLFLTFGFLGFVNKLDK